jgi:hypothetical protein
VKALECKRGVKTTIAAQKRLCLIIGYSHLGRQTESEPACLTPLIFAADNFSLPASTLLTACTLRLQKKFLIYDFLQATPLDALTSSPVATNVPKNHESYVNFCAFPEQIKSESTICADGLLGLSGDVHEIFKTNFPKFFPALNVLYASWTWSIAYTCPITGCKFPCAVHSESCRHACCITPRSVERLVSHKPCTLTPLGYSNLVSSNGFSPVALPYTITRPNWPAHRTLWFT